jgi:hypothetical protein
MTTFTTRLAAMLAAGTFLLAVANGASTMDGLVEVPAALNPDKLSIFRVVSAKGVQIYMCTRNPAGATSWVLRGPDAQLFDQQNKPVGKHYAGPTWEGLDGACRRQSTGPFLGFCSPRNRTRDRACSPRRRRSFVWERPAAPRPAIPATRLGLVRNCAFPTQRSTYF